MLKNDYQSLCEYIKTNNLMLKACYPDFLALPYEENKITVVSFDGRVLVRQGKYVGHSFIEEHLVAIAPSLVSDECSDFVVYGDEDIRC